MAEAESLKHLIKKRGVLKAQITKFSTYIHSFDRDHKSLIELQARLEKIENLWSNFQTIQTDIEIIYEGDDDQSVEREAFENTFFDVTSFAKQLILDIEQNKRLASPPAKPNISTLQSNVHLPPLPIPEFDGNYKEWSKFHDTFKALVHNNENLKDIQKFYFLNAALKGKAKYTINSIEISDANYIVAWELLKERFENLRAMVDCHLTELLNISALNKESFTGLRKLLDTLTQELRSLEALGISTKDWDPLIIHIFSKKLDQITKREWECTIKGRKLPTLAQFKIFLNERCQILEALNLNCDKQNIRPSEKCNQRALSYISTDQSKQTYYKPFCKFCKKEHFIFTCPDFLALSVKDRQVKIKKLKLCLNCFRSNHLIKDCTGQNCKICQKKHNTLLHYNNNHPTPSSNPDSNNFIHALQPVPSTNSERENISNEHVVAHSTHKKDLYILLSTANIFVFDHLGKQHSCRVLLDNGSQSNFVTYELMSKLKIPSFNINLPVTGINQSLTTISHKTDINISSMHTSFSTTITCLILDQITHNIPTISFDISTLSIPKGINLADPFFHISNKIDMLLGASIFWDLIGSEKISLAPGQPHLYNTKLGWIISGPYSFHNHALNNSKTLCNLNIVDQQIHDQIEKFWKIEEFSSKQLLSQEEAECEKHYVETTIRDKTGHFEVTLPFRENIKNLGDSREIAINRFYSTEKKLLNNPDFKRLYIEFMQEYETLGHMSKITDHIHNEPSFYLPHHGVMKESSTTTKLRVVFDGSTKSSTGISLNDTLKVGPTIQQDLYSIILRFRQHNYVLTADIEKMYRQINVNPKQCDYQRIVWRKEPQQALEHFRLNTVTYGTASAAFLAIRSLHEAAYYNQTQYPIISSIILNDFYVDDLITGTDTVNNIKVLKQNLFKILEPFGFTLRKWMTNCNQILDDTDESHTNHFQISDDKYSKILGLSWHSESDTLTYTIDLPNKVSSHITKRFILSTIAKIFDPLGLAGPIVVKAKIIMQKLWELKLSWDEEIPDNLKSTWLLFYDKLPSINQIKIPRHVLCFDPIEIQLHGFSDSSELAYGACIYLRSVNASGHISVNLLTAKSRVAPLKTISLPRLELCGALLLAKLSNIVNQSLNISLSNCVFWCDSTITLSWIASAPNQWKTFIANRTSEIQRLTNSNQWKHINSSDNPADIISRGMNPETLVKSQVWWKGPSWLSLDSKFWPISDFPKSDQIPEKRKLITLTTTITDFSIFTKFSSLLKLQRVIAYCLRFKKNLTSNCKNKIVGHLTLQEINEAMSTILRLVQIQEFSHEISCLKKSNKVAPSSKLVSLNPFLDNHDIIRVGGRLEKSNLSYDNIHPIILPKTHTLTDLIILHEHHRLLHAGTQATLFSLRQKFWPLNGKNSVKKIIRRCITCFKVKPIISTPKMGNLPDSRIQPARPFSITGVDYAGPFSVKNSFTHNRKFIKCYMCVFVCFATKAVHLELVSSLDTQSFLNTLKRFISRRGLCRELHSDNGTNFVGANNDLKELYQFIRTIDEDLELTTFFNQNQIIWKFIPPKSPHFGGLWEAAVKSAKYHLKRIVSNTNLTFEHLYTVLTQVEAILNSRPLCPLSNDPNDLSPLTPGHFLIGQPLMTIPSKNMTKLPANKLSLYNHMQQLVQHFWQRWSMEYLSSMQARTKWKFNKVDDIKPDTMVLLKEENLPPMFWKLGRVVQVHPGSDSVVRVLTIKTKNGILKRSVHKVCILPIDS